MDSWPTSAIPLGLSIPNGQASLIHKIFYICPSAVNLVGRLFVVPWLRLFLLLPLFVSCANPHTQIDRFESVHTNNSFGRREFKPINWLANKSSTISPSTA